MKIFRILIKGDVGVQVLDPVLNKETNEILPVKLNEEDLKAREKILLEKRNSVKWENHPSKKDKSEITLIRELEVETSNKKILKVNAVVLRINKKYASNKTTYYFEDSDYNYIVFYTTNLKYNAKKIISLYTKRSGIEEQYKQLKVFWGLEDLKSRKFKVVVYQVMTTVNALAMVQLFWQCDEFKQYANKSIDSIKNTSRFRESKKVLITIVSSTVFYQYILSDAMELIIDKPKNTQQMFLEMLRKYEKM